MSAALGFLHGAPIEFQRADDVPNGGILCALPALLANGLLHHSRDNFSMREGYYPMETIFLILACMALARVKTLEQLRYQDPGEWGKLLGLDRIPEVKTLRGKIDQICQQQGQARQWAAELSREWMEATSQAPGIYYADGHVRVYHGRLTSLPRRYVARQRLCLRGTTDYWVHSMNGQPFFMISQPVDPGMIEVMNKEIIPQLLEQAPQRQIGEGEPRFTVVFDREGYSPKWFAQLKVQNIAVLTYHKFPGEDWPLKEFHACQTQLVNGESVEMELAERGTCLSNGLWIREIRKHCPSGHQTSIISTDYHSDFKKLAPTMFARWCQENFFKYMREHFNIDRLSEYGTEQIPDTTRVVNPAWRKLDSQIRSKNGKLTRLLARLGQSTLSHDPKPSQIESYEQKNGRLQEESAQMKEQIEDLKKQRKDTPRHLEMGQLPEEERFQQLRQEKKYFIDTIKLIAYRSETALVYLAREKMKRRDDARSLIRQLFNTSVDLLPDTEKKVLTVRLHHLTANVHEQVMEHLCQELTATETIFPGSNFRLVFETGRPS